MSANKLWDLARRCFECNKLIFQPNNRPFLSTLLAAKFRHHKYYLDKFGEDNFLVSSFELHCIESGINRQTIYRWGKWIEEWTVQENASNLLVASDGVQDAAQESAALKDQVLLLKERVASRDQDIGEMKRDLQQANEEIKRSTEQQKQTNELLTQLLAKVGLPEQAVGGTTNAASTSGAVTTMVVRTTNATSTTSTSGADATTTPSDDMEVDGGTSGSYVESSTNPFATVSPPTTVQTVPRNTVQPRALAKQMLPNNGLLPQMDEKECAKISTVDFLVDVGKLGLQQRVLKGQNVFHKTTIKSDSKTKIQFGFKHLKESAGKAKWDQYLAESRAYVNASKDKDTDAMESCRENLWRLCRYIQEEGYRAYWDAYTQTEEYATVKNLKIKRENAKKAFEKIGGFANRLYDLRKLAKKPTV